MNPESRSPNARWRRILGAVFIVFAVTLVMVFTATTLSGDAVAAPSRTPEVVTAGDWKARELSPEWRWQRDSVKYQQMYRQRPERRPVGSFDRVLDMAGR